LLKIAKVIPCKNYFPINIDKSLPKRVRNVIRLNPSELVKIQIFLFSHRIIIIIIITANISNSYHMNVLRKHSRAFAHATRTVGKIYPQRQSDTIRRMRI